MDMNRRFFFKALPAFSVGAIAITTLAEPQISRAIPSMPAKGHRRISIRKGDPGELMYAIEASDGNKCIIYLDGVEQEDCVTADEAKGLVVRYRKTPKGNFAINYATNEVLEETVYGRVEIEIVPVFPA